MKVLILDDEANCRRDLCQLLEGHEDLETIGEAADVAGALVWTQQHQPDVAFLDVRLRGETAFDYVGKLSETEPHLVFVTAYDEYAVRGFECNALDYLMKPVLPERLAATLERIRRHEQLERRAAEANDSVFLRFGDTARLVPWKEISRLETSGNYTRVVIDDGSNPLVLRPIKDWLALMPKGQFVQVHRNAIIRLDAIQELRFLERSRHEVVLTDGVNVAVSRGQWPELKAAIQAWHPEAEQFLR